MTWYTTVNTQQGSGVVQLGSNFAMSQDASRRSGFMNATHLETVDPVAASLGKPLEGIGRCKYLAIQAIPELLHGRPSGRHWTA